MSDSVTSTRKLWILLIVCLITGTIHPRAYADPPPNVVYILADDLGIGDLGCYGQKRIRTPNLDKLAAEGMRFTQHYAGSTVCAPSRSVLMSGLHTGHTAIRGNKEVLPEGQFAIGDEVITLAELLQGAGYATGAFGKWGLGAPGSEGDPLQQGFDHFFGYNCQRLAHNYYPHYLWDDTTKISLPANRDDLEGAYAPALIQEKILAFIEDNKAKPFFLYVPSIIPHAELRVPDKNKEKYRGRLEPEKTYQGCDFGCERYKTGGYGSQTETHAAFAGMVDLLDEQVGQIVKKINDLGLETNTLILFSSDNGPHMEGGADPDYFDSNGIFRGYKRDLYEGGIRVPMIVKWPGRVGAGTVSDHISAFWDVLPTITELTGVSTPAPIDGISFLPTLLGKNQPEHDYLYWEFHERGGRRAIRKGRWKMVLYDVKTENPRPAELYDLNGDPAEKNDLAAAHPEVVAELTGLMEKARRPSPVREWNF